MTYAATYPDRGEGLELVADAHRLIADAGILDYRVERRSQDGRANYITETVSFIITDPLPHGPIAELVEWCADPGAGTGDTLPGRSLRTLPGPDPDHGGGLELRVTWKEATTA